MAADESGALSYKVRADAFYVRATEGVWLRNNHGSFIIRGKAAYTLVDAVLPRLDGNRTVDEVCADFPAGHREAILRLITALGRHGFLRQVCHPPEPIPEWAAALYPEHLAFLEHWTDRPVADLIRVSSTPVACAGTGPVLRALVAALAELGFAEVTIVAAATPGIDDLADAAARRDLRFRWRVHGLAASTSLQALANDPVATEAAAVLIASDAADIADVQAAEAVVQDRGQLAGFVAGAGELLVASPLAAGTNWCAQCLLRAVVAGPAPGPAPPAAASLAGFQLGHRLFCRLAGPPVPEDTAVTTVDTRTLTVRPHRPRPHQECGRHGHTGLAGPVTVLDQAPTRPDIPGSNDPPAMVASQDRIVTTTGGWTDRVTGPLLSVGEQDRPQLPLAASCCRVRAPGSLPGAPRVALVECRAAAAREARNQVVLLACEWLAERTAAERGEANLSFGAGWSAAEAAYRALAAAAGNPVEPAGPAESIGAPELSASPLRTFLLATLDDAGCPGLTVTTGPLLPSGFVGAWVRHDGRVLGRSVGLDAGHAADGALLATLTSVLPSGEADLVGTARLRPPVEDWSAAVRTVLERAEIRPPAHDARDLLPFLDDGGYLVAVPRDVAMPRGIR